MFLVVGEKYRTIKELKYKDVIVPKGFEFDGWR